MQDKYLTFLDQEIEKEKAVIRSCESRVAQIEASKANYQKFLGQQSNPSTRPNNGHAAAHADAKREDAPSITLPARGLPSEGRARDIHEALFANPTGLGRAALREITRYDATNVNTVLDRGVESGVIERIGELFRLTAKGIANLKRSTPYTGSITNFRTRAAMNDLLAS